MAENIYISLAGSFDDDEMLDYLNKEFGGIKQGGTQPSLSTLEYGPVSI